MGIAAVDYFLGLFAMVCSQDKLAGLMRDVLMAFPVS